MKHEGLNSLRVNRVRVNRVRVNRVRVRGLMDEPRERG